MTNKRGIIAVVGNQCLGYSISNCPSRDKLKVQGMEYDLSKKKNAVALVSHIESGIKIDGVFDVQSKSCFESVDHR